MHTKIILLSAALAGSSSAAVTSGTTILNRSVNWTQLAGATASQSSEAAGGLASRGIDGNTNGQWAGNSVTHTDPADTTSWWQVDLGTARDISTITLHNRTDCCGTRLSNYSVLAGNDPTFVTSDYTTGNQPSDPGANISFIGVGTTARYVRVQRDGISTGGESVLSLAEVQIMGDAAFNFTNLAIGSTASQSTTHSPTSAADSAIDQDFTNAFPSGSTTHTVDGASGPVWWETVLPAVSNINEIALFNRGDCCADRLSNFRISIFNGVTEVWGQNYFEGTGQAGETFAVHEDTGAFLAAGDRVRIQLINDTNNAATGTNVLSLREVEIYGTAVPEPSSLALLGLGGFALILRRKK